MGLMLQGVVGVTDGGTQDFLMHAEGLHRSLSTSSCTNTTLVAPDLSPRSEMPGPLDGLSSSSSSPVPTDRYTLLVWAAPPFGVINLSDAWAKALGLPRRELYKRALELKGVA